MENNKYYCIRCDAEFNGNEQQEVAIDLPGCIDICLPCCKIVMRHGMDEAGKANP